MEGGESHRLGQGKDFKTFSNPSQTGWTLLYIIPDRDVSKLFCERKSKTTPSKTHQQLVWGTQLEPTDKQTWCWSSASFSCSSCSRRILSSSACLCCSSKASLFSSSCLRSSSSCSAFSSVALLAVSSSLILVFPRYRLLTGYLFL